jgi:hypothetical protein
LGLVALVLFSLVFSDIAAMRHAGNCCGEVQAFDSAPVANALSSDSGEVVAATDCSHHACDHSNPFRRHLAGGSNDGNAIDCESQPACPCSSENERDSHDRNRCAVCHWFAVLAGGLHFDVPVIAECGELVCAPILIVAGLPSEMIFLPTVSRRGPPSVA